MFHSFTMGLSWWLSAKKSPANAEDTDLIPGQGIFLERETATHSSILVWKEESRGQRSVAGTL